MLAQRLNAAAARLAAISETPLLDAEILMAHTLGMSRSALLAHLREPVDAPEFDLLVQRRANAEPIAYILGHWEFFSLDFSVRAPLLVPRPETEHLVETVLNYVGHRPARVLEIGTGTGCVSIAIAVNAPQTTVTATDIRADALAVAAANAYKHQVADRVTLLRGDLFEALETNEEPFDVICSNPPYVKEGDWDTLSPVIRLYEDRNALLAGPEGLAIIEPLVRNALRHLRKGGLIAFEMDDRQRDSANRLLMESGYANIAFTRDLAGLNRIASAHSQCIFTNDAYVEHTRNVR